MARELIASGNEVWGVARTSHALTALKQELGDQFKYTVADLAKPQDIDQLVLEMDKADFYPNKVFLIAGVYSTADKTFSTQAHCTAIMEINFQGSVRLFEALVKRREHPKHVIVLSSVFALLGDDLNPSYAEAKAKLANYFIAANSKAINTKVVYLGPVNTSINQYAKQGKSLLAIEPEAVAKYLKQLPNKQEVVHFFPFSINVFYQIFRLLPKSAYSAVMKKARR